MSCLTINNSYLVSMNSGMPGGGGDGHRDGQGIMGTHTYMYICILHICILA